MQELTRRSRCFARDVRGATAIEYGLIAALIAIAGLAGIMTLGGGIGQSWNDTAERVTNAMSRP